MIDVGTGFSREQLPLAKDMLVGSPKLGSYLVQLFSNIFIDIDQAKRGDLYNLTDSQGGRYAFLCIIDSFDHMNQDKKLWEGNTWNKNYNQEKLLKAKLDFLDMLPESFGSYERNKISVALDKLFPGEKETTKSHSIQQGFFSRIKKLVAA